jgi:hypothetical protein
MGFVFKDHFVKTEVDVLLIMTALNTCVDRVGKNQADAALTRWFGDSSPAWKKDVAKRLSLMKSIINLQEVHVEFTRLADRDAGTNAAAAPGLLTSIDPGKAQTFKGRNVRLDVAFHHLPSRLPLTGGTINAGGYYQSKLETILHELSHAILSTNDEDLANGNTAYGAQQAAALAVENPALAKTNAENWGIFIEACGVHKTS